jgi:uncharacterized membrane protein YoaT (DUF817 family)
MIVLFVASVPLLFFSSWMFFKKPPQDAKKSHVFTYNLISFFFILLLSTYFGYNSYTNIINTVDRGWAPVTVFISFSFIFLVSLIIAFVIRNFLLFRKKD